jgi:hypothetical protein
MRTGFSDSNGKKSLGICLDDLVSHLSSSSVEIRNAVKTSGFGRHNIAKDFVPVTSTDPAIKRGSNSRSRKCTVIWLDCLPQALQDTLKKGN